MDGDFAGWLCDAMAARGMSQRMLAALSGIDHSTVSRLLSGDRQPALATALALIRVLERPRLQLATTVAVNDVRVERSGTTAG